jgi:hypothetical protein
MPCARGCCDTQAEHYRSIMVANPNRQKLRKTTTDVHDHHTVDVTEHWHDRQDVAVHPDTIRVPGTRNKDGSITIHEP